jgi:hypothetical protein
MRSPQEAQQNTISEEDAAIRGMSFGWEKIFRSATYGKLSEFAENYIGAKDFGQGVHALQDAFAHKGTDIDHHNVVKDGLPSLTKEWTKDYKSAFSMTLNAINVHSLLSGDYGKVKTENGQLNIDTQGMSEDQVRKVMTKIQEYLRQ